MKTIYVRVAKKGVERFHRCGHQFSGAWAELVGIDDATAQRLREEQMLEVSDVKPEGFEPTAEGDAALQLFSSDGISNLERQIITIVGTQLDTTTLDAIFDAISEDNAATHRADGDLLITMTQQRDNAEAECSRLAGLLEQSVLEAGKLAEENTALRAQLTALNTPAAAAAPVEATASTGEGQPAEADQAGASQPVEGGAAQEGNVAASPAPESTAAPADEAPAETTKKARK